MQNKILVFCVTVLLVSILACGGCAAPTTPTSPTSPTTMPPTTPPTEQPQYGGTLRILTMTTGTGIIGVPWEGTFTGEVIYPCLDRLVNIDFNGITPCLATGWVIADDGKSITFTLRQDVKFQDGTKFDAEAEKWNLDNWMAAHQEGSELWTSVEVLDLYTVRINLTEYKSTVLSGLAGGFCGPISPTAYEQNGKKWAEKNPVGTGPFKLVSLEADVGWSYVRNDDWWGGKPYLDAIEYKCITDMNTAQMMIEKGETDVLITSSGWTEIKLALKDKGFVLIPYLGGGEALYILPDGNNPDSPWAKKEVRLAADYALDRETLAALGKGMGGPTWQIAGSMLNYYDPALKHPYDPEKARDLLAQAGYPNGFDTTLNYMAGIFPQDFAVAIQSMLKDVGINLELNSLPPNLGFEMSSKGWHNGFFGFAYQQATNFCAEMARFLGSNRFLFVSGLSTPELRDMIDEGLRARTFEEQKYFDAQVNKYLYDEAIFIPFYINLYSAVKAPYVHDDGFGLSYFWTPGKCWLSK
jgi:peptide/nickel transport system substrate-binding protein